MSLTSDQLFALLPAIYRTRDAANGDKLRALFDIMASQSDVLEQNIRQLYDDQFIETCAPWVIPYIGDLLGYNSVYQITAGVDTRAEVANTIGYRRRKGTHIALEQAAMDVSGRAAVVVEEFKRLITTLSLRHPRPKHSATLNLRRREALERLDSAFDSTNRTIDVRRIAPRIRPLADPDPAPLDTALHGPGRNNIPDIAIHLWRWRSWFVTRAPGFAVGHRQYRFSPLGHDSPLFSKPPPRTPFQALTTRADVPQLITRSEFGRQVGDFYGSSILLYLDEVPVEVTQIISANLAEGPGGSGCRVPPGKIAIDPELGRIQLADDVPVPGTLRVSYCYGFPAAIGGGPYDRSAHLSQQLDLAKADFFAIVGDAAFPTLESAVAQWNSMPAGISGVIILPEFASYTIDLTGTNSIRLPAQSSLAIVSATPATAGGPRDVIFTDAWPTLTGNLELVALAGKPLPDGETPPSGQLLVSGVRIAGQLAVSGAAVGLQIADATLVPGLGLKRNGEPLTRGEPSIVITATQANLCLVRSITGSIAADSAVTTRILSSIVDSTSPCCIAYAGADLTSPGGDLHVEDSTIVGKVRTRTLQLASNTLFVARLARRDPWPAPVWCSRQQAGCVRFCYLPFNSMTPRRYRCLPDNAADEPTFTPEFITLRYGHPSYALLSGDVALGLWQGADNGSQPGAYFQIQETEAVRNVAIRAPEFLPVTFESGIFLIPSRPLPGPAPAPLVYGVQPAGDCCSGTDASEPVFVGVGAHLL